ncbi:MAG: putative phage tail protein [Ruminococcus sp.]
MSFDLEHFPRNETAKRMVSRVSPIYENSYVGKWLFEVMGIEMEEARALIESIKNQCFPSTATWGLRYWEQRYNIAPDESRDIKERRAAVLAKLTRAEAMTPAALEDILKAATGRQVEVHEGGAPYTFTITIGDGESAVDYGAVAQLVDGAKPSHLAYSFEAPGKGKLTVYIYTAVYIDKGVQLTEYDRHVGSTEDYLIDEAGAILTDEQGRMYVDD